ncbi:MAG: DUF2911 domain-containing protein [Ignavibacteriae bacterium]|nr:DUF2911 domain-containing protein [Ignavibacteriota bacterium]
MVGITEVTIKYHRPGVKGRIIWGGLVPYDSLWRTGANEATTISFTDTVSIEGNIVPPGTYGLATIPGRETWIVIFHNKPELGGVFNYKREYDVLRILVSPQPAEHQEWMRFSFEDLAENSAQVVLHWGKLKVPFTISVPTTELTLLKGRKALGYNGPLQFANYCLQKGVNLDEAMKYIDISMMYEENYWNTRVKAQLLEKMGKKKDGIKLLEKAIAMGKKMENPPFDFQQMRDKLAEWKE